MDAEENDLKLIDNPLKVLVVAIAKHFFIILSFTLFASCAKNEYETVRWLNFLEEEYNHTFRSVDDFLKEMDKRGINRNDLNLTEYQKGPGKGKEYYIMTDKTAILR